MEIDHLVIPESKHKEWQGHTKRQAGQLAGAFTGNIGDILVIKYNITVMDDTPFNKVGNPESLLVFKQKLNVRLGMGYLHSFKVTSHKTIVN